MTETAAYKSWLVNAPTNAALVDAVILSHASWPQEYRLINWDRETQCDYLDTDGTPVSHLFQTARFELIPATLEDSMAQSTRVAIASTDGAIYDELNKMDADARATPIRLRVLQYLDTDFTTPNIQWPYPVWTVDSIGVNFEAVVAELGVPQLRVRRIGRYYTQLELPVLVYL